MKCYIVSFEVATAATKNRLTGLLKAYGNYCPINDTCWAIMTDNSAAQIRDYLKTSLQENDRIFVVRSGTGAAWLNAYGQANTDWLKKNL